jgi:hypothetical protein
MGEMTGGKRERFGRGEKHLSHSLSPLYKAFLKNYGRDKAQIGHHVAESSNVLILLSEYSKIRGTFISVYL